MRCSLGQAGLTAAALVLAAACSSGDAEVSPSTTSAAPATTVESTMPDPPAASSTTIVVSTTSVASTTVPDSTTTTAAPQPTTVPSSTPLPEGVPPRVTFPDDPDKQAVVDAAYAFFDAARAAQAAPADEGLRAALAETMTDPVASRLTEFLDELVVDGVRIVPSPDHSTYLDVYAPTVLAIDGSGIFDACSVDGDVRVAEDDLSLVSANIGAASLTYSLMLDSGRWRVFDVTVFGRYPGEVGCDGG